MNEECSKRLPTTCTYKRERLNGLNERSFRTMVDVVYSLSLSLLKIPVSAPDV